jgi:hypothetical protein
MSTDRNESEAGPGRPHPRKPIETSLIAAIAAGVVGLSALGVSVYEAYLMREQQRASVWPIVEAWSFHMSESGFGVSVANKGIGPALLRSVDVSVDGVRKHSWQQLYGELLGTDSLRYNMSAISGNVLAAGEMLTIFSVSPDDGSKAFHEVSENVSFEICYCSVFEQCWVYQLDNLKMAVPRTEEIDACTVDLESGF